MKKEEILNKIKEALDNPDKGRNSMGCSEANYDPFYAIGRCFTEEKLLEMDKEKLENLIKLGEYLSEAFY